VGLVVGLGEALAKPALKLLAKPGQSVLVAVVAKEA